jgi:hypothetical protein
VVAGDVFLDTMLISELEKFLESAAAG